MSESTERKIQVCQKCGEENPAEAVLCWACYSPLGDAALKPIRLNDDEPELRFPQPSWWRDNVEPVGYCLLLGALISSGWWRGKTRFATLGAGGAMAALLMAQHKRAEGERQKQKNDLRDLGSPICRIIDTLLIYAIKDKASQVRITRLESGLLDVFYLLGDGEWHQQMRIPGYVWRSLQNEFFMRAETGAVKISPHHPKDEWEGINPLMPDERNIAFSLRILIEPPRAEILLTRL